MTDVAADTQLSELSGRQAVVTGASRGIGRAIAVELAVAGANVLVHAGFDHEAAMHTAEEVEARGRRSGVVVRDLCAPNALDDLVEQAWEWAGGDVHIWVNNAGADVLTGAAAEWPFDQKLHQLWQVDVQGTIGLSRRVGQHMATATTVADRVIVSIGWDRVETGMAGDSGEMFAAIKGAITAFSRSLAKSLAPAVRVNCVAPGWIRTAWAEQADPYWQQRAQHEALRDRWGTPEDVAHGVRFLVSPRADFITGQVLAVNGGHRDSGDDAR